MLRLRLLRLLFPVLLAVLGLLLWSSWNPRNRSHGGVRATDVTDISQAQGVSVNRLTRDTNSDIQIRQVQVFEPGEDDSLHVEGVQDLTIHRDDR